MRLGGWLNVFWCWFYFTARTSLVRAQWLEHTLAPRLPATLSLRALRRRELRNVWDLAVSLIIRSDSEDSAGKGHSDSVVPPAGDECVFGVGFILLPARPLSVLTGSSTLSPSA